MPKLPTINGVYVPKEVEFVDETDKKIKPNSKIPKSKQVKVNMTYATLDQKSSYMQSYGEAKAKGTTKIKTDFYYDAALKKHIQKIENLSDDKDNPITSGHALVNCQHPFLNDFKQDLFFRICGIRNDQDDDDDDGPGAFNEGED